MVQAVVEEILPAHESTFDNGSDRSMALDEYHTSQSHPCLILTLQASIQTNS